MNIDTIIKFNPILDRVVDEVQKTPSEIKGFHLTFGTNTQKFEESAK